MRFAGQRFRSQNGYQGDFRMPRERADSGKNSYANPTGTGAMTSMREVNANQMAKIGQPDLSDSPFNFPEIQQPEFRHSRRV